ncbi:eukaryotic translation initiation factor 3 subunit J [Podospora australis]|uniref:Eukaryotic translation initiation factor 3 subunit J n=1 Tax=Podospora australis TaxID=1536484 RepID=A0AAN7AH44_9PEZI|nr:eukaryotic translation initiation factor 3 subunit J [Podospora australis]
MPGPSKRWDDEDESSSSGSEAAAPAAGAARRNKKFDDEEAEDSDVLDSWDAAEDSEVEREKAKKAAEAKAKADAEAAANKKSKAQRIAERQAERARQLAEEGEESDEETEEQKRERLRRTEKESDLKHAEDLFGSIGISSGRKANASASVVALPGNDPNNQIDLSTLPIFNPITKSQFEALRNATGPLLARNAKKAHFVTFAQEYFKQIVKECKSDEIKKIASSLTALSNERLKEEKASMGTGKKTKASKTKTSLAGVTRQGVTDTNTYEDDDGFGDDDFM